MPRWYQVDCCEKCPNFGGAMNERGVQPVCLERTRSGMTLRGVDIKTAVHEACPLPEWRKFCA